METTIQIQTGTFSIYGALIPIFTTIHSDEIKELTDMGYTRMEAINLLAS